MKHRLSTRFQSQRKTAKYFLLALFGLSLLAVLQVRSVSAHYLNMTQAWALMDQDTLDLISTRVQNDDQPLIRAGDEITLVMKAFPDDGTNFGAGGYMTFFIPEGTQVLDTAYVWPDGTGNYIEIPVKQPSPTDDDAGDRGDDNIPELVGLTFGPNAIGRTEAAVDNAGNTRGTLVGVMGDTGAFYSTDPRTSWNSWHENIGTTRTYCSNPGGDCDVASQANGATTPFTAWDAMQVIGYGSDNVGDDVINMPVNALGGTAYIDPSGNGSTAWGLANAVAGPESGYAWEFDLDKYDGSGSNSNVKTSVSDVGPWQRIQYPGATISDDRMDPGNEYATSWTTAGSLGRNLTLNPLPATLDRTDSTSPKAIRFSVGGIQQDRFEYISVTLRVLEDPGSANPNPYDANGCFEAHAGSFAGDAGFTDNNKDHIYRYIKFSTVTFNPCTQLSKRSGVANAKTGDQFQYHIDFVNTGSVSIPAFTITDPLPGGLTLNTVTAEYIDSSTQASIPVPNSGSGTTLIWNLATVAPGGVIASGDMFRATVTVTATSDGSWVNVASTNGSVLPATEETAGPDVVVIVPEKSVDPPIAAPGSAITYTLEINNLSAGATVTGQDIVVEDFLPSDFTYVNSSASASFTDTGSTPITVDNTDPENPIFTVTGAINGGESLIIVFQALIDITVPVDTYFNSMSVTYQDPNVGENIATCFGCAPVFTAAASIGDYIFYDWNGDGVQDPEEEGIPGVELEIEYPGGGTFTTTTDINGNYLFAGLAPGTYTVTVTANNFNPGGPLEDFPTATFQPPDNGGTQSVVTLGVIDEIRDRDWGFAPDGDGTIGDFIFHDVDESGTPTGGDVGLDSVTVYLYEDTDGDGVIDPGVDQLITTTTTAGGGAYSFTDLPEGFDYLVYVDPFDPAIQSGMPDDSYTPSTDNPISVLNLSGTNNSADIGFRDVPSSSIGDQVCIDDNADGLCTGADTPLGDVTITLWNDVDGNGVLDPGIDTIVATTVSNSVTGQYLFGDLPPGDYLVDIDNNDPDVPSGYAPSDDEIAVNLPVPPPLATSGTDVTTADFPFVPLIAKSVSSATASPDDILTYSIDVRFPGSDLLSNVVVSDVIPAGTSYLSGSANAGGIESGGVVTWDLGSNDSPSAGIFDGYDYYSVGIDSDKDTYLNQKDNNRNYGIAPTLVIDPRSGEAARPLVEFDVSSIPVNAEVTLAYIEMYQTAVEASAGTITVDIYALTQDWAEGTFNDATGTASWNQRLPATAWTTVGGTTNNIIYGSTNVNTSAAPSEFEFFITDLVQDWVDGSLANEGALLRAKNETGADNQRHIFSSSDGAAYTPELFVNYRVPNGPERTTTLSAEGTLAGDNTQIKVTMALTTATTIVNVTPSPLTVIGANGASADNCSAPSPAGPFTVVAGTTSFVTYTCDAVAGTDIGNVRFSANATTSAGYTFKQATTNSVIVAPTLTFNVKVDRPPTADPILNTAIIADDTVIPPTTSNEVQTDLRAAIGDTVWYDANANGIQDNGELGIPGVEMILTGTSGTFTTTTDANGVYVFGDLDAGTYTVAVNTATLPISAVQTYDLDGILDDQTTVTLTAGEWQGDADFGYNPQLIVKEVDLSTAAPNDTLTYTSTVIYPFDAQLTNVTVTDAIPVGTTYVPSSASPTLTTGPDPLVWTIGSNLPGTPGLAYVCAASETIYADRDTWINQDKPTDDYGTDNTTETGNVSSEIARSLFHFDLSSLPANADVSQALLTLKSDNNRGGDHFVNIYRVTGNWSETSTWNSLSGGSYNSVTSYGTMAANQTLQSVDIAPLVSNWANGTYTNYGILLNAFGTDNGNAEWVAREDGDPTIMPRLDVSYEYISPDGCLQTVQIPASFDTWISQKDQADNNSEDNPVKTGLKSGETGRALFQFDLSAVPAGAVIDSADFVITSESDEGGDHSANIRRITSIWADTANWTTPWSSNGGDFDSGTSYGVVEADDTTQSEDITSLVLGWADGSFSNYGLLLDPFGSHDNTVDWTSSEDDTDFPYLEVTFRSPIVSTTLPATQDTYIDQDKPADDFSAQAVLKANPEAGKVKRPLYQFDTSTIPTGATLSSAVLNISSGKAVAGQTATIRRVTTAWTDSTTNWTTPWTNNGGDFTGTFGTLTGLGNDAYATANITGLVSDWADGTLSNYGVILDPSGSNGNAEWNAIEEGEFIPYITATYEAAVFGGSSMNVDRALVSDGDTFNVTLTLTATALVTDVVPSALTVVDLNAAGGSASCSGTPTPAMQDVPAGGSATFTWACTASAGTEPSNLTFSADAAGGPNGLLTYAEATSDSILVAPPYVFQVTVNDPLEVGRVDNISYIQDESDTLPSTPSNEVQTSMGPDLIVVKTSNPASVNVGDSLQYTLAITNTGLSDATNVVVTDTLPAEVTFVNAVASQGTGCSEASGIVTCDLGTLLASGGAATVTIDVTVVSLPAPAGPLLPPAAPEPVQTVTGPTTTQSDAPTANPNLCYAVGDGNNQLVTINRITGTPTSLIGNTNVNLIEAITMSLDGNTVYAANGSTFGTLNTSTGAYTSIGSFGTGTGALGSQFFGDVDGLAIDAQSGIFYGTVRTGGNDGAPNDLLIQINPATGAHVNNAFGTNIDYVVINTTSLGLNDVDDIAVDPSDGQMYAVANIGGGTADRLIKVNKTNGAVTDVAIITKSGGGGNVNDMEGFSFYNDGTFYGTTGGNSTNGNEDSLWQINETTGVATLIGQFSIDSDYEGVGCLTGGSNTFSGIVFEDIGADGNYNIGTDIPEQGVTVNLWQDNDNNGVVSVGDVLLQSTVTLANGTYEMETGLTGDFVIEIDQTTLPPESTGLSTTGEYDVSVTLYGNDTTGLDFGFITESADLAVTKTVNNETPNEDETITYTIVATNNGPDAATGVVVNDTLPAGVSFVSYSASTGTYAGGVWTIGALAASSSETLTITVTVDSGTLGDTIINTVTIEGNETDPNTDNNKSAELLDVVCLANSIYNIVEVSSDEFDADSTNNVSSACTEVLQAPDTGNIGNRVWLDENGDGVQDAGEDGIVNVVVTLTPPAGVDLGNGAGQPITTTTGTDGGYIFTDLPPNTTYTITIAAPTGMFPTFDEDDGTVTPNNETVVTNLQPGEDHDTSDFGLNWVPPTDSSNPPANATGAIGDFIWNDADGDGVQDPGEIGLSGITVTLKTDDNGDGIYGGVGDNPDTVTTTNASGHYIFDNLPAGAYVVEVDPGNLPTGWNPSPTGDPDGDGDNTSEPIVLAPGDVYVNADFGYQPDSDDNGSTDTGSTIGDQVFLDLDGDGTQDAGEPGIPGVTVSLVDPAGNIVGTTTTDENGNYEFPNLPAGTYTVVITDTDNVLGGLDPISNPVDDTGPVDNAGSPITVDGTPGDDNDVQDFGFAPEGHNPADTNANGAIGDTVFIDIDGDGMLSAGEGVEGVTVTLEDSDGNTVTAVTDVNGNYIFGSLDPLGTYTVTVDTSTLPNGGSGLFNTVDPIDDTTAAGDSSNVIDLSTSSGVNLDQDFGYSADDPTTTGTDEGNHIEGTVWNDTNADGTLDTPDEPGRYAGVTIELWDDTNDDGVIGPEDNLIGTTTTDANGDYSFEGLPPGDYLVDVTDEDNVLAGTWHSDGPNDGADDNSQDDPYDITFTTISETNDSADFGYYNQPAAIGNYIWLDVNNDGIQDANEPGLGGMPVTLTITYPNGDVETVVTETDNDGFYSFPNLLLDENYNGTGTPGSGGTTPSYMVTVATPNGLSPTVIGAGNGANDSGNGVAGEAAAPVQGSADDTVDFGYQAQYIDMGDLPDPSYPTLFANAAATVSFPDTNADNKPDSLNGEAAVWLGAIVDYESDGQPTADADGDDNTGLDDEDGVVFTDPLTPGSNAGMTVTVNSSAGTNVNIGIWIDWNADGVFDTFITDSGTTNGVSPTDIGLNIPVPLDYAGSEVYYRVRAFPGDYTPQPEDVSGVFINGEVEDYKRDGSPTGVTLRDSVTRMVSMPTVYVIVFAALMLLTTAVVTGRVVRRRENR